MTHIIQLKNKEIEVKLFKGNWNYSSCKNNPEALFVFGDNLVRKGKLGQACIRYCSNSIGIPTQKYPSTNSSSYFCDKDLKDNISIINDAIEDILNILNTNNYTVLYLPENGFGTGLANLKNSAPVTFSYLNETIKEHFYPKWNF